MNSSGITITTPRGRALVSIQPRRLPAPGQASTDPRLRVERHGVARLYPLTPEQQVLALHGSEEELAALVTEVEVLPD